MAVYDSKAHKSCGTVLLWSIGIISALVIIGAVFEGLLHVLSVAGIFISIAVIVGYIILNRD